MYYEYYTDIRATSVEQARHDGFFFLRFPLRASRPPPPLVSPLSPHASSSRLILLFQSSCSIPRLILLASPLFLSPILPPLLSYFFILRPRASGRFNVRDFFSPSLVPAPFSLSCPVFYSSSSSFSFSASITSRPSEIALLRASRRSRAAMHLSRLCNRAPGSTKLHCHVYRDILPPSQIVRSKIGTRLLLFLYSSLFSIRLVQIRNNLIQIICKMHYCYYIL